MDGIPALDLWDLIVAVLHGITYQKDQERGDPYKSPTREKIAGKIDDLDNVDFTSSNVNSSRKESLLYIFEDNEAVIKMIIKARLIFKLSAQIGQYSTNFMRSLCVSSVFTGM